MARRVRTVIRLGAFAALALLLTGCIKLNMDLGINQENTVGGTIQFGVDKQLLELSGQNVEDLLGGDSPFASPPPGVSVEPFDDGEFAGQELTLEAVPLEEFNSGDFAGATGASGVTGSSDELTIERQGDVFVVTGVLDFSSALSGATGPFGGSAGANLFRNADIRLAFTFPGEVIQAPGGQIDGNTVTYTPEFSDRLEINATGSAIENGRAQDVTGGDDGSNVLLFVILGAAVAVLLVVLFLVLRGRNKGAGPKTGSGEAAVAAPQATAPPAIPSGTPPAATPPAATPPGPTATPPPAPPPPPPAPPTEG